MTKSTYLEKLATNFIIEVPGKTITKEQAMNYYMHQYSGGNSWWDNLTVNDILAAAEMAGKKIKGKSSLEVNVSFREQLEFHSKCGHSNRHIATERLENNKSLIIGCFLKEIPIKEIADNLGFSKTAITRFLTKKGIREKGTRQKTAIRRKVSASA